MALTDKEILALKPQGKKYKVFDGDGLHIVVCPRGSRYWYMKYHVDGRPQEVSFGAYPKVSLKLARERRDEARQQLARGLDPRLQKKIARQASSVLFAGVAEEWVQMMSKPSNGVARSGSQERRRRDVGRARWTRRTGPQISYQGK